MKNIKQQILRAGIAGLIFICGYAAAADVEKIYVGVSAGGTNIYGDAPHTGEYASGQHFDAGDTGYNIHLGYQVVDWFAAEVEYVDFGSVQDTFKIKPGIFFIVAPNTIQSLSAKGEAISAIFSHKLANNFSILAVVGINNIDYDSTLSGGAIKRHDSATEQGLVYGVGAKYAIAQAISLRAELRRYDAGDYRLDAATLGVDYSF